MITLNPKDKWLKSPFARLHAELVVSEGFQQALQVALTQMTIDSPGSGNPSINWDAHCQLVGARRFITILLNLSEVDTTGPQRPSSKNLFTINSKPQTPKKHASDSSSTV